MPGNCVFRRVHAGPARRGRPQERATLRPVTEAFGQPGAGGGHAFADPENNVAFAYLMNQMELGVLPNEKSLRIVEALYAGAGTRL